jgi:16S rRNA (cytidine1402-2'-O)-methyltransferase
LLFNLKQAGYAIKKIMKDFMDKNNGDRGLLYIVATPIGNLEDITLRAIRILKEVELIAAEDTRHTRKLLNAYKIATPLISLHQHNEREKSALLIAKIMGGMNVAYVSDAGTPCLSDPGYQLVNFAQAENIRIIPIPGPSALIAAMSVAGIPADNFSFCGFLPARENKRRLFLESLKDDERTIVFYESPTRFLSTLKDIYEILGNREIVVARELTKIFEEIRRGEVIDFIKSYGENKIRGEFTVILRSVKKTPISCKDEDIEKKILLLWEDENISLRDAVNQVVEKTGLQKKKVYDLAVKLRLQKANS